jgi:SRSO17 transposase
MSLLDHPKAQALLEDARLTAKTVADCRLGLQVFVQRYLPRFARKEQGEHAQLILEGRLSSLERKTSEPIAHQARQHRKPVQNFVGAGAWDDEVVLSELRRHVRAELGDAQGVLVLDSSGFPKKGTESCGVARQWCGRLGKVDNCQVGVFWGYAAGGGHALVDHRLYLPQEWMQDRTQRRKCHVPPEISFREKWRIGLERLERIEADLPWAWIAADEEFGRVAAFRAALRQRRRRYVVDIPSNTLIREVGANSAAGRRPPFVPVATWAAQQPSSRWQKISGLAGEKGERVVRALSALVQTKDEDGCVGPLEQVVVIRNVATEPRTWFALSNAKREALAELVRVKLARHHIEELFQEAKGEVGLHHYEVRSWVGWHHHMTLGLLAAWFLNLQKRQVRKKNAGDHGGAASGNLRTPAAQAGTRSRGDRRGN